MVLNLQGKSVIITGGSSGLGKVTAGEFAEEGANVALTYNNHEKNGIEAAEKIASWFGVKAVALHCDLSSEDSIRAAFAAAREKLGDIDVLVNNAGYWPSGYVRDITTEDWKHCIDVNLTGHFIFSREFVKYGIERKKRVKLVNIVSFAGYLGSRTGHAHYASAKAGLVNFTKSLAREVGGYGINVNAVSPGMVYTEMTEEVLRDRHDEYTGRIPLGRIAEAEEIAHTIVFLSSDKADYITGATVDVSGGLLMH